MIACPDPYIPALSYPQIMHLIITHLASQLLAQAVQELNPTLLRILWAHVYVQFMIVYAMQRL